MLRQSPSRNQRSKGIKIKQVLQICLLLAVCFWLIYQVKHSHDKKKEFDENDAKKSLNIQIGNEIFKFGRKDLHPQVEETTEKIEKHDEEETEEEETGGGEEKKNEEEAEEKAGEEENKHEEEDQEEENKIEEKEDEGRGAGEDDIDEDDQEKTEVELDREEDFIDEEKETEEGDEKESEVKEAEDKDGGILENESSLEDHDHDEGNRNTREAREEQYKADDASSAVTHDTQTISTENENGSVENSNEKVEVNILERQDIVDVASSEVNHDTQTISTEDENGSVENSNEKVEVNISEQEDKVVNTEEINVGQNTTGLKLGGGAISENGTSLNAMLNEEKGYEILVSKSEGSSFANSTITMVPNDNQTEVSTEFHGLSLHNGTETTSSVTQAQNVTEGDTTSAEGSNLQNISFKQANYSNIGYDNNQSDLNSTTENVKETLGESSNISTNSEVVVSENIVRSNASTEAENSTGSSLTEGNSDATQNEKLETSNGADESSDSNKLNNGDEIQHDPLDSSIPLEEKEIPTDTLPEIRMETRSNSERAAAE